MEILKKIFFLLLLTAMISETHGSTQNNYEELKQKFIASKNDSIKNALLKNDILKLTNPMGKDSAIVFWNDLIKHCEETGYRQGVGFCYYNLGIRLNTEGEYFQSYLAFQNSKNIYSTIRDKYGMACVYNGLGNLFNLLYKYDRALTSYLESAELFKEMHNPVYGSIYLNIGGILVKLDSLQAAKSYLEKSRLILTEERDTSGLINCFINLSEVYLAENNTDSAFFYLIKSKDFLKDNTDVADKFNALLNLGYFYLTIRNTDAAEPLLSRAYYFAENEKFSIPVESRAKAVKALSELYDSSGDAETALGFLKKYFEYQTESKRVQSNLDLSRIEFESLERERMMERRKRVYVFYTALVLLIFSLLIIFTFYRSYKIKQKANRLLTEMDELKTRLYSNITHELRTPLTLILGPLEKMLATDAGEKTNRKQVKTMRKNARRLLNLVNEMLDLAKIDAKSLKLEMQSGDIAKFIRIRFAVFATMAEQKQIDFQIKVSEKKIITFFDASKLEKIINNLLSNAVKFTPKNGKIRSSAIFHHGKKNSLEIIIEDTGKGIPADELTKIFDRFHQVENTQPVITPGTGIGLSLTNELVTLMHGNINVESEPGKGSRFRVLLPLGIEHFKKEEYHLLEKEQKNKSTILYDDVSPGDEPEITGTKNINAKNLPQVLVAEDQDEIREFILENLRDNFSVFEANNGTVAYQKAVETIPDLVVTDLMMPEMDGNELCEKLKTDERTSHIPVIILTGKSGLKDKINGLESGADAFLTKPFSIKELQLRISKLIEQRQKLRERFTRNLNLEPKDIAVTSADEKFLTRALEVIEKNMGDSEFEVTQFQKELLMSRMQLFRKIKALTNQTPGEFIRTIRLKRAAKLIEQNFGNIAQITYEVGFNNPSYFAKCFKNIYGKLPSEYHRKS